MAINCILAMTAAEIRVNSSLPSKIGWLSCHFSPCTTGLSNLPDRLPQGSVLILDDLIPFRGHDPDRIASQLREVVSAQKCGCVLLDLQRKGDVSVAALARTVSAALPCPVGVSDLYAQALDCPVFLPPVPADIPIEEYLQPWRGREIWLDAALDGMTLTLTAQGASSAPLPRYETPEPTHRDEQLHCHYSVALTGDSARFTLCRTPDDLKALLAEAATLGVTHALGLWQELGGIP